jgi:hypothetical protein
MSDEPVEATIKDLAFQCVRLAYADFSDTAAVYAILCVSDSGKWTMADVGQSGEVGTRIDNHDRKKCWQGNCTTKNIWVCVY